MSDRTRGTDWVGWLRRWDAQQESFNPERERRFEAMLEALGAWCPPRFLALDVGCGPGSLTQRVLRRFPRARAVAVDFDPVVLRVGREALRPFTSRLSWVDADLRRPGWSRALPERKYDAIVSTTALHWLTGRELRTAYREAGTVLRRGGLFLNGDHLPWDPSSAPLPRLAERISRRRRGGRSHAAQWRPWKMWWRGILREPALRAEVEERERRFTEHPTHRRPITILDHERALRAAGFRAVGVLWQNVEDRVLVGLR